MDNKILRLKEIIKKSTNIVVFTGAGISVPSGIPDFRSASGIYNEKLDINYTPEEVISHSFFCANPKFFYDFYFKKMVYPNAKPNKAHLFFAKLSEKKNVKVITQNIDNLHQEAGSKIVYELHGSTKRNYCTKCGKYYDISELKHEGIPYCSCGGIIKPDVVLYEENLDYNLLETSIRAIEACETLIVIGTSLIVNPAASLIRYYFGHNLVIINKEETSRDSLADLVIHDDIINVINELEKE